MHLGWNFFLKKSSHKMIFIWLMFLEASIIMTFLYITYFKKFGFLSPSLLGLSCITALSYFFYQIGTGLAYEYEDMSLVYPLTMIAPLFIPVWAWFILGEIISKKGLLGIILCGGGVYIMPLKDLKFTSIIKPFTQFKSKGVRLALFAGFISSIGAVLNKLGLIQKDVFAFSFSLTIAITVYLSLYCLIQKKYRTKIVTTLNTDKKILLLAGCILTGSILSFQTAISLTKISYASPARRIGILFGVLIGIFVLKEKYAKVRIIGSILIVSGIFLLKMA